MASYFLTRGLLFAQWPENVTLIVSMLPYFVQRSVMNVMLHTDFTQTKG